MKTIMKLVVGTAVLAAGATAAHASGTTLPSTDNSNLLFFVTNTVSQQTYTQVLTQSVGSAGDVFSKADAVNNQSLPVQGTSVGTIKGKAGFTYDETTNTALENFIAAAPAGSLQWGVMGGAYSGASPTSRHPVGNALAVSTSTDAASVVQVGEGGITGGMIAPTGLASDIKTLNGSTFDTFNGTTTGVIGTPASSATNINFYGTGINVVNGLTPGTKSSLELYGLSSNGGGAGQVLGFDLGAFSFNGTSLVFTGIPTPLPAAAWLLGSGLLGLLGIGRRRNSVVAA